MLKLVQFSSKRLPCIVILQGACRNVPGLSGPPARLLGGRRTEDLRLVRPQVQERAQIEGQADGGEDQ